MQPDRPGKEPALKLVIRTANIQPAAGCVNETLEQTVVAGDFNRIAPVKHCVGKKEEPAAVGRQSQLRTSNFDVAASDDGNLRAEIVSANLYIARDVIKAILQLFVVIIIIVIVVIVDTQIAGDVVVATGLVGGGSSATARPIVVYVKSNGHFCGRRLDRRGIVVVIAVIVEAGYVFDCVFDDVEGAMEVYRPVRTHFALYV